MKAPGLTKKVIKLFLLVTLLGGATGCAATVTALKYKDLEVQTKMSETIFLEPVSPSERTVWIEVKNTSDQDVDLSPLAGMLQAKGWKVVQDPDAAHYRLQVNVLYVGKASQAAIDNAVYAGFGGPLFGAATGALAGVAEGTARATAIGGLAGTMVGGAAEVISGALVKAVTYTVITDVQLSERSATPVAQQQTATLIQGTQTQVTQEATETSPWKRYRNRIASTATKVNLDFEEAKPVLVQGLLKSLAGLF